MQLSVCIVFYNYKYQSYLFQITDLEIPFEGIKQWIKDLVIIILGFFHMKKRRQTSANFYKNISNYEVVSSLNRAQQSRQHLLKQLQQLDIEVQSFSSLPLQELMLKVEEIMKNTYSIKYLGLSKNHMGIVSRRINPLSDQHFKVDEAPNQLYSIHKYLYPKPLRTIKKKHSVQKISVDNLESQIKKEFDSNRKQIQNAAKQEDEKSKTRIMGSWCPQIKENCSKKEKKERTSVKDLPKLIQAKMDPSKSYSRFLQKGILVIRD